MHRIILFFSDLILVYRGYLSTKAKTTEKMRTVLVNEKAHRQSIRTSSTRSLVNEYPAKYSASTKEVSRAATSVGISYKVSAKNLLLLQSNIKGSGGLFCSSAS